ncbi:hypothetical protein V6N12_027502 [Hibiscus sabdariffa]|uniref:Uncharacterized protein n=1 Tax=Hibiscus sabdariffa TaxID=183260 RepID=A0ABR2F318_9ROSI
MVATGQVDQQVVVQGTRHVQLSLLELHAHVLELLLEWTGDLPGQIARQICLPDGHFLLAAQQQADNGRLAVGFRTNPTFIPTTCPV